MCLTLGFLPHISQRTHFLLALNQKVKIIQEESKITFVAAKIGYIHTHKKYGKQLNIVKITQ